MKKGLILLYESLEKKEGGIIRGRYKKSPNSEMILKMTTNLSDAFDLSKPLKIVERSFYSGCLKSTKLSC
jgi:hypothetical protein